MCVLFAKYSSLRVVPGPIHLRLAVVHAWNNLRSDPPVLLKVEAIFLITSVGEIPVPFFNHIFEERLKSDSTCRCLSGGRLKQSRHARNSRSRVPNPSSHHPASRVVSITHDYKWTAAVGCRRIRVTDPTER
jgi:hypothetical protein